MARAYQIQHSAFVLVVIAIAAVEEAGSAGSSITST